MFDHSPALYSILSGDATLTAMLSTYGGAPAIFTEAPIPEDAGRPYIVSAGALSQSPLARHMTGKHLPRVQVDVTAVTDASVAASVADAIADRVHALMYIDGGRTAKPAWTGSGYELAHTDVIAGPSIAPTDDSLRGRVITVQLTFRPT